MSDEIIKVEGLGKRYQIGAAAPRESYTALRDVISRRAQGLWHGAHRALRGRTTIAPHHTEEFWALNDVSFDVRRGDVLGIIGRNGAGKSTLLKILSRITEPTAGRVTLRGRVASLLEVGTGFHPELTGRENIFLNGAILGMTRAEVKRKFDEIVAFAEVEKFLDTPVKRYSSGMFVRLAFAVAAHLEPEILVVDEVLAVGDAEFQKKCLGKMGEVAEAGRTVLFVSHNMTAMKNMCTHGILLNQGQVVCHGDISATVHQYSLLASNVVTVRVWDETDAPGTDGVKLLSARLVTAPPASPDNLTVADPFGFEFRYLVTDPELKVNLSLSMFNGEGACIFTSPSICQPGWFDRPTPGGLCTSTCDVPGKLLNDGHYSVALLFVHDTTRILFATGRLLDFDLADDNRNRGDWHGTWNGVIRPELRWRTWSRSLQTS